MKTSPTWVCSLCVALLLASNGAVGMADEAAPAAEQPQPQVREMAADEAALCWLLFGQAPPDRRVAALEHLQRRYKNFTADILALLSSKHPDFYFNLDKDLARLLGEKHPKATLFIDEEITRLVHTKYRGVVAAVDKLVRQKYPQLIEELRQLPAGKASVEQARELIRSKYPQLAADVLLLLHDKFPDVLSELQAAIIARFPHLVFDLAALVWRKYPDMVPEVLAMVEKNAPGLMAELADILGGLPGAATPTPAVPAEPAQ